MAVNLRFKAMEFKMNQFLKTNEATSLQSARRSSENDRQHDVESNGRMQPGKAGAIARGMLKRLLAQCGNPPICIILPSGEQLFPLSGQIVGTIKISDFRTVLALALDPIFQFGEAYADRRIEIQGDVSECLSIVFGLMNEQETPTVGQRFFTRLRRPYANTLTRSKDNISHHYDLGNRFYRLWLDEKMVYTCAYFAQSHFTLEQAQTAKMDHVCRKLRLRPGMQVVEAGCGWGSLALHMTRNYGVRVTAYNISQEQVAWAQDRAKREGLQDEVHFVQDDWRNIEGKYDAFVSVGMLEHVGVKNYRRLGQLIRNCLRPGRTGLIHTIGQNQPSPFNPWIERRIFPGAYTPTIKQMMEIFQTANLTVLDLENLRLHYAETLRHWLSRFESSVESVRDMFDERFVRMWRMYLAGSVAAFDSDCLQLFQVLFVNGRTNQLPRTREHLYDSTSQRIARVVNNIAPKNWNPKTKMWGKHGQV